VTRAWAAAGPAKGGDEAVGGEAASDQRGRHEAASDQRGRQQERGTLVGAVLELDVGAPGHGGFCVARHDGRAVFVRHALPGERVRAAVTEQRRSYLRADAVEVTRASPDRVTPPCRYAGPGRCGGCDWQHVRLDAQRRLKATVVAEQLRRLAGLDVEVVVEPVSGSSDGLGWRTRVAFAVRPDGVVGLRRHRSHTVQPVGRCLIASPGVEAVGAERVRWPGVAAVEVIASAGAGERAVIVTPRRRGRIAVPVSDPELAVSFTPLPGSRRRSRPARAGVHEVAAGRRWQVSGTGFWQVHPGAADVLVEAVAKMLQPRPGETAIDLFSGVGLFAAVLARHVGPAGSVVAVEAAASAVADARHNLADLPQVQVRWGRVDAAAVDRWWPAADLVVLDPPRSGAGPTLVAALAGLRPRAVAYVACDPAALARDVAAFAAADYRLSRLRAFDLFPMTAHVECVALLAPDGPR